MVSSLWIVKVMRTDVGHGTTWGIRQWLLDRDEVSTCTFGIQVNRFEMLSEFAIRLVVLVTTFGAMEVMCSRHRVGMERRATSGNQGRCGQSNSQSLKQRGAHRLRQGPKGKLETGKHT